MSKSSFDAAVDRVFKHEGGYINHPKDPGGATKYGITLGTLSDWRRTAVTANDVRLLSQSEARNIYYVCYWRAIGADALPSGLGYALFDVSVHSGVARAKKWLEALPPDVNEAAQIKALMATRLRFLQNLSTWKTFGRGWAARLKDVEKTALKLAQTNENERQKAMQTSKPWFTSKTIWSSIITVVASLGGLFGLSISGEMTTQLVDLIVLLITTISGLVAVVGRVNADKKIA